MFLKSHLLTVVTIPGHSQSKAPPWIPDVTYVFLATDGILLKCCSVAYIVWARRQYKSNEQPSWNYQPQMKQLLFWLTQQITSPISLGRSSNRLLVNNQSVYMASKQRDEDHRGWSASPSTGWGLPWWKAKQQLKKHEDRNLYIAHCVLIACSSRFLHKTS